MERFHVGRPAKLLQYESTSNVCAKRNIEMES